MSSLLALIIVIPVMAAIGFGLQLAVIDRALAVGPLAPLLATFGPAVALESVLLGGHFADTQSLARLVTARRSGADWLSPGPAPIAACPRLAGAARVVAYVTRTLALEKMKLGSRPQVP